MSEGAAVPEKAKQALLARTGNRDWIDRAIWTERMLAALDNGVKGNKWFSLIDKVYRPQTLAAAWQQVKVNKGAAGIDGQSIERFAAGAERYLSELAEELKEGRYRAAPVRRVDIPKAGGKTRPLGIPTVKDRIVQTAVKRVIEPIFEQEFLPMSYGFRPGRGCKDALREVDEWLKKGYTHVVDADLQIYFDSIPHARLKERIEERISDGRLLELLAGWLRQDIIRGLEKWTPTGGTPQGAVISPLLANIYGYFKHAQGRVFQTLDALIRRRLRALLRKQETRPGFGRCYADHCRWPNAFFAAEGLFTMVKARRQASQSR